MKGRREILDRYLHNLTSDKSVLPALDWSVLCENFEIPTMKKLLPDLFLELILHFAHFLKFICPQTKDFN